jgi:hypothetical protein
MFGMVLFEMYLLKNRVFIILIYLLSSLAFSETNSSAKQLSVVERLIVFPLIRFHCPTINPK